jgi:hypothetical protein
LDERCLDTGRYFRRQQAGSSSARLAEHRKLSRGKEVSFPVIWLNIEIFLERNLSVNGFIAVCVVTSFSVCGNERS